MWWKDVVAQSTLLLSSPVVQIDTSGDDVIVTDTHGNQHAARQVIVTVSIGVLQSEIIDFLPDLPDTTVSAYNGIGIDMGMKVPMNFSTPWWETEDEAMAWLVDRGARWRLLGPQRLQDRYHLTHSNVLPDGRERIAAQRHQRGGGRRPTR